MKVFAWFLLWPLLSPAVPAAQESRELAGIAEEQALLRRQVQRLRSTMEVLLGRVEAEGRGHVAALLREALSVLDQRQAEADAAAMTLDQMMEVSRESIEKGQVVQALERQEQLIADLEHLLSVLMDRKNLESLDRQIDELKELQEGLDALIGEERRIEDQTAELRENAATEAQRALSAQLAELIAKQAEALSRNEELGRASGTLELELLERELEALLEDQRTDAAVLAAWDPAEAAPLSAALEALERALAAEARAERLSAAAGELREAADGVRAATPEQALERPWADDLVESAAEERRAARVGGDPAAERAAEALEQGAEVLRAADLAAGEEARAAAAGRLEELAAALEREAAAAREPGRGSRAEAQQALEALAREDGAAAAAAAEALSPLREAAARDDAGEAAAAAAAIAEAERALRAGREELDTLPTALARSQAEAAERAERLARGLGTLPAVEGEEAARSLSEAAGAMSEASRAARQQQAGAAGESAARAVEALEAALGELAQARADAGQAVEDAARENAGAQAEMAEQARSLAAQARESGLDPVSGETAAESLSEAAEAMARAAGELSQGKSASAAGSQREAGEALQRAAEAARRGVQPTTPEDRARAEELARRQQELREQILDLARRAEERKNAKPLPSLDRADASAQRATEALDQGDLDQAEQQEERTRQELERAQRDLREEEEAYQRLRQEEVLFRLAEEAVQMLAKHREQMTAVKEIDAARAGDEEPSRSERLRLRNVSREEQSLGERAGEIAAAIEAENSEVTASLMRSAESDLARIARDLGEEGGYRTGEGVQAMQRDVEESLEWLIEALRQEQRRREEAEQRPNDGNQEDQQTGNSLVPDETELKLLRRLEVEVQQQVEEMLVRFPELESPEEVDPLVLEQILRIASKHERVTELFVRFRERLQIPGPNGETPPAPEGEDGQDQDEQR